jgi:hypothetical protein
MGISLPFQVNKLSRGLVIQNIATGKRFEVITVDSLAIKMRSIETNDIVSVLVMTMDLLNWCMVDRKND